MSSVDFSSLAGKRYSTIVIDPPWQYEDKLPGPGRGADKHYGTMTIEEIMAIPLADVAEPNAHLYCWVTNSFIREGFAALDAWGFEYKQMITWTKINRAGGMRIGMGRYFRNVTEHALFATRGSLAPLGRYTPNLFFAQRCEHSAKPEEFYYMVRHVSPGPRLDVFARRALDGFDIWGNEAPK